MSERHETNREQYDRMCGDSDMVAGAVIDGAEIIINWPGVEKAAAQSMASPVTQEAWNLIAVARMLIAVRDGTWVTPEAATWKEPK
jgi:hypothetical protein